MGSPASPEAFEHATDSAIPFIFAVISALMEPGCHPHRTSGDTHPEPPVRSAAWELMILPFSPLGLLLSRRRLSILWWPYLPLPLPFRGVRIREIPPNPVPGSRPGIVAPVLPAPFPSPPASWRAARLRGRPLFPLVTIYASTVASAAWWYPSCLAPLPSRISHPCVASALASPTTSVAASGTVADPDPAPGPPSSITTPIPLETRSFSLVATGPCLLPECLLRRPGISDWPGSSPRGSITAVSSASSAVTSAVVLLR